jgi:TPR repeat protein
VSWFRKAADQGDADAQNSLGVMYEEGQGVPQDYAAAASWFRKAADQGDAAAQNNLGVMYANGHGVPRDYAAAAGWWRKAADQGDASAQVRLGIMYEQGQGVPRDYAAAVSWFRKAADQGDAGAQYGLGNMYVFGEGVRQDYAAATSWFRKAADQGHASAQYGLGYSYGNGQGVPQDYVSAYMWFNLAAAGGGKDAARERDVLAAKMTPAQIAEAQGRAAEWRPRMANAAPPQAERTPPSSKETDSEAFSGTAFFVSKDGKALTNAHVVRECRQISVNTEGQSSAAKVLARDDRNDLALLTTELHPAQSVNWRLSVRQGEDIVVYGFPLTGVLASGGNVATGNITALAGLGNDSRFLQISAPVQPGNSGGPLLDRNGTLVGVVVAKLDALGIASATGDIPQNVNFAIKASVAAAFLDAQHVAHAESAGAAALSTPDLAERAKSFTIQVICFR